MTRVDVTGKLVSTALRLGLIAGFLAIAGCWKRRRATRATTPR